MVALFASSSGQEDGGQAGVPRRAFLLMPPALAALLWTAHERTSPPANPNEAGTGPWVNIIVFEGPAVQGKRSVRMRKLILPDAVWSKRLKSADFAVARRGRTELAFTGRYARTHTPGLYRCVCCGTALFASQDRFESGTGWPSFSKCAARENVWTRTDGSLNMERTEVLCSRCDAHLGHVFKDGPPPTGLRYCINSAALYLQPAPQNQTT